MGGLGACTKLTEHIWDYTHPLPRRIEELYVNDVMVSYPREFQRVFQRGIEGRHKNDDIMSSEMEDAAFDYYRRQIRTSIVGETDEDIEDVAAYKLGLDRPSAKEQVWLEHVIERNALDVSETATDTNADAQDVPAPAPAPAPNVKALMVQRSPMERASIEKWIKTREALEKSQAAPSSVKIKSGPRPRSTVSQAVATSFSAGLGLALGAIGLRGLSYAFRMLRSKLNLDKKQGKAGAKKSSFNTSATKKNQAASSLAPSGQSKASATPVGKKEAEAKSSKKEAEAKSSKKEAEAKTTRPTARAATKKR